MKKSLSTAMMLFILLFSIPTFALVEIEADEKTIAWDAVVPIVDSDVITYNLYTKNLASDEIVFIRNVPELQAPVQFETEGKFAVGVSTVRTVADGKIIESEINWSNVNGESTPNPFVIIRYVPIGPPINLNVK